MCGAGRGASNEPPGEAAPPRGAESNDPETDAELARELSPYRDSRRTLKFPLSEVIPYDLVERAIAALAAARGLPR